MAGSAILKVDVITDAKQALAGLDSIGSEADRTGGRLAGFGKAAGIAFAAVGTAAIGAAVGAVAFGKSAVNAASDLNETISKTETIFGDSSKEIIAWSETAAKSMGLSKNEALTAASGFQNMFSQIGIGADEGKNMSTSIVQISSDLASFHNVAGGAAEVTDLVAAAMRGEYDSIQKLVPTLNAAAVEQRALADTGKATGKELTNAEKATATYALIMEGAGAATGDFAKTAGGLANSTRTAGAQFDDIKAKIGQGLLPVVTTLVNLFSTHVLPIIEKVGKSLVSLLAPAFAEIAGGIRAMIVAFQNSEDGITSSGVAGVFERIGLAAGQALPIVIDIFNNVRGAIAAIIPHIIKFGQAVIATVVPAVLKIAVAVKKAIPPILDLFRDLAEDALPKVQAALQILIPVVATVIETVVKLAGWLAQNRDVLAAIVVPIVTLVVVLKTITVATQAWAAAQTALNVAMAMNPIGLIIAATVALIAAAVLVWRHWDQIWTWIMEHKAFAALLLVFAPIIAQFVLTVGALKFLWENWDKIWGWITDRVDTAIDAIMVVVGPIAEAVGAVFARVKSAVETNVNLIRGYINLWIDAFNLVKTAATELWQWITDKIGAIAGIISGAVSGVKRAVDTLADAIKAPINLVIRSLNRLQFTIPKIEIDPPGPGPTLSAGPWNIDVIPGKIPELAGGGLIARGGLAIVHAGETVIPAGNGRGTNVTINVTTTGLGADAPQIQRAVANALRGYTARNGPLDIPIRGVA